MARTYYFELDFISGTAPNQIGFQNNYSDLPSFFSGIREMLFNMKQLGDGSNVSGALTVSYTDGGSSSTATLSTLAYGGPYADLVDFSIQIFDWLSDLSESGGGPIGLQAIGPFNPDPGLPYVLDQIRAFNPVQRKNLLRDLWKKKDYRDVFVILHKGK